MVSSLSIVSRISIYLIYIYQYFISYLIYPSCRFYPTCSEYAKISIYRFGLFRSIFLITKRICKCHPLHTGGFDSVPIYNKEVKKHHGSTT
ncbi:membrane protein insertion efficiency factor YidD [Buchnera aphidicola]|uniref:membrane protein insertion efficiency factor YidD n=1 Tax=Buchnera aphidicola TaxID=9 RepID=UPI0031B6C4D2